MHGLQLPHPTALVPWDEEGLVPFLPTQVACPSSQPQMVGCAQGWPWFAR